MAELPSLSQSSRQGISVRLSPSSETDSQGPIPGSAAGIHTLGPKQDGVQDVGTRKWKGICHDGLGACWCSL